MNNDTTTVTRLRAAGAAPRASRSLRTILALSVLAFFWRTGAISHATGS